LDAFSVDFQLVKSPVTERFSPDGEPRITPPSCNKERSPSKRSKISRPGTGTGTGNLNRPDDLAEESEKPAEEKAKEPESKKEEKVEETEEEEPATGQEGWEKREES